RVGDKSAAIAAAKKMTVGDMPSFQDSMQLAFDGLKGRRAGQKHVIIISDGDPSPPRASLLDDYVSAKITVTTVMVAGHGGSATMQVVANKTGGRFYRVTNPKNLPKIFIKEAQLVSRSLIQEGDTYHPKVVSRLPGPTEGFSEVPSIDGYVLTAARAGLSQIPIVNRTSEGDDPIYAYWNYGLGKSIAYTSDLTGLWGSRWAGWAQFQSFWEQSIRWVMRPSSPANMIVNTRLEGDVAVVEIEALNADASFMNFLRTSAVVLAPDATATPLALQQTGPGRYRGEFRVDDAGAYLVNVNYAGGTHDAPLQGNLQAAVSVPYSREFRAIKHNAALLTQLATRTGGRVLDGADPTLIDLFDREGLEVPRTHKRIWDLLAIIAAMLFVLDVAARRVSVDPKRLMALVGKAVGRRGEATTDTVAAWKRTRARVAHRRADAAALAETADARARFEADESDLGVAIDVGTDVPRDLREGPAPTARTKPAAEPEPAADEGDYTSRLLAAKRRARGLTDDAGEGGDDA
ncbi:MAG: glutamine amidotransferase, partial [Myxococcota bacterium]